MVSSYDGGAIPPRMTTFILHPERLIRAAAVVVDHAEAVASATAGLELPDSGVCDHGWFDALRELAARLEGLMALGGGRLDALARAATTLDGEAAYWLYGCLPPGFSDPGPVG